MSRSARVSARGGVLVAVSGLVLLGAACAPGGGGGGGCTGSVTTVNVGEPPSSAFPPPTGTAASPPIGWWSADTRTNGTVTPVAATYGGAPGFGCTAAKLTTGASTASPSQDKAQLFNYREYGTPLIGINNISYWAYKSSTSTGGPAIDLALNVQIYGSGVPTNSATLVYEPYQQSGTQTAIQLDTWQQWDATATTPGDGRWWTSKIASGPGSQAQPIPWAQFQAMYPTAAVAGYGFNLGSSNPNTVVAGDGLVFGSVTTDF